MVDHSLVGTPGYQAPEFLRGGLPHPAVDIYALGILFWQLDAREVPFQVVNFFSRVAPDTALAGYPVAGYPANFFCRISGATLHISQGESLNQIEWYTEYD